jgi:hypothetical protein
MPTVTVPLGLTKPTVGGDKDVWGQYWNDNADKLNAIHVDNGTGTAVGMHVGATKTLNVEGIINFADPADVTKRVNLLSTNVTTATTRTLYFPDEDGTLATKAAVKVPTGTIYSGYYGTTPPPGFVMADGRTIGDATSGATNRAHADTVTLFTLLWNITTNAQCAVSGGRGANAVADYGAHKTLTLPNHSGRTMAGRDDLSGTAAGIWSGATVRAAGSGVQSYASGVTVTGNASVNGGTGASNNNTGTNNGATGDFATALHGHNISLDAPVSGATAAFSIIQPTIAVDVIIAL